jgi:uncharacterized membrane protein YccF (DUF307 family)
MRTLLNIIWFIFSGLWLALGYWAAGLVVAGVWLAIGHVVTSMF